MSIRVAIGQFHQLTDEMIRFAVQLGVTGTQINSPSLPGETHWEERDLRAFVEKVEAAGLRFEAIENATYF